MTAAAVEESGRTRVEQYRTQADRLAEREAALVAFIESSPTREADERVEALRKAPLSLPGATSPVEKERRKREEAERSLVSVRANAAAIKALLEEAEARERAESQRKLFAEASAFQKRERESWQAVGDAFAAFVEAYRERLKPAIEQFDAWREAHTAEVGGDAEQWRSTAHHVVEPVPSDLKAVFETLLDAAVDPHGHGYRRDNPDTRPVDDWDELRHLVADLQGTPEIETLRGPRRFSDATRRPW